VVDAGDSNFSLYPVIDSVVDRSAIARLEFGGHDLTEYLRKLLAQSGASFTDSQLELVRDIKEKYCRVSTDHDYELSHNHQTKQYTMPDGQVINIGKEAFRAPEAIF